MITDTLAPAAATPPSAAPQGPNPNALNKTFTPLVAQFLEYLKLERHFSDYTVKSYGADLVQFGQYLAGEIGRPIGAPEPAGKLTPETNWGQWPRSVPNSGCHVCWSTRGLRSVEA